MEIKLPHFKNKGFIILDTSYPYTVEGIGIHGRMKLESPLYVGDYFTNYRIDARYTLFKNMTMQDIEDIIFNNEFEEKLK